MTRRFYSRLLIWTFVLLLVPFTANVLYADVNWDVADFVIMAVMLFGMGSGCAYFMTQVRPAYKPVVVVVTIVLFLLLWAELAVGIFTHWGS